VTVAGGDASVLLGTGRGGFTQPALFNVVPNANGVAVADFNGDGDPDLAFAHAGAVTVRLGGDGATFGAPTSFPALIAVSIETGDLNADGDPDLVIGEIGGHVQVLLGSSGGSFAAGQLLRLGNNATDVALGDFDRDHDLDVAIADPLAPTVPVGLGVGDGTFTAGPEIATSHPFRILAADVNRDGDLDLVEGSGGALTVLYGGAGASFPLEFSRPLSVVPSVGVGDFNGDDDVDVITGNAGGVFTLLLGATGNTLAPAVSTRIVDETAEVHGLVVGEWTGDDRPDVVVSSTRTSSVALLPNTSVAAIETNPANLTFRPSRAER
jgi:hypothetical protein